MSHAQPRFYPLKGVVGRTGSQYGFLADMCTTPEFSTLITLRSTVQVRAPPSTTPFLSQIQVFLSQVVNELDVPVEVFTGSGVSVSTLGRVGPLATLNLPLPSVYEGAEGLLFKPQGYSLTHPRTRTNQLNLSSLPGTK